MYSKVKLAGHPVHPMLVGFPVAFYTATLVAFIVYAATDNPFWFRLGCVANWAGVVMAAVAALPGFIDWATGIPRGSAAKKTGLIHMALNVTALTVFLINAVVATNHWDEVLPPSGAGIVLSAIGVLITLAAGFLGWSLVQDHHVGVRLSPEQERLEPVHVPTTGQHGRPNTPAASH
jgi:uncharacterized membrane protein